ncbi:hypothetical protein DV711_06495 [Motiliproteus coralliicola]|uniref:Uncharacterized protein n=1 Tax=Motiliproteus coralliicola TaxID=2283196 RepID=A0A369WUB6_9GAMM|nr:hypothetical protein [Motiliproteus coralliicola]RDE25201.1 hypothetical protein DV711_06495 [Motiliproteus coralliicola]
MNINDPFGRMGKQRQREYESLREQLHQVGLSNRVDAQELISNLEKRQRFGLVVIIPIAALLALLFPDFRIVTVSFGALACLWLVNTTRRGKMYIERFIKEELADHGDSESF